MKQDINYTINSVIDRLQRKVYARRSVQPDAVACDNIRLAIKALRRLIEPETEYSEPIDIFEEDQEFRFETCWTCDHCKLDIGRRCYVCEKDGHTMRGNYEVCRQTDCKEWTHTH